MIFHSHLRTPLQLVSVRMDQQLCTCQAELTVEAHTQPCVLSENREQRVAMLHIESLQAAI